MAATKFALREAIVRIDIQTDRRLAEAFRKLSTLGSRDERFTWIEREVFSTDDFIPANAPADPFRETLMRWWLELFETE